MTKPIFIAMTTHNFSMSGMNIILAAGHNKQKVETAAKKIINRDMLTGTGGVNVFSDTELKNLRVVSKTVALRVYKFDYNRFYPSPEPHERFTWVE